MQHFVLLLYSWCDVTFLDAMPYRNALPLMTLSPSCVRSDIQQHLVKDSHVITVPSCLAPLVSNSGMSILAGAPILHVPLFHSPWAVPPTPSAVGGCVIWPGRGACVGS